MITKVAVTQRHEENCYFDKLPNVLAILIFSLLKNENTKASVRSLSLVCKKWNRILYTPSLWKREIDVLHLTEYNPKNFKKHILEKMTHMMSRLKHGELFLHLSNFLLIQTLGQISYAYYCIRCKNSISKIKKLTAGQDFNFFTTLNEIYRHHSNAAKLNLQTNLYYEVSQKISKLVLFFDVINNEQKKPTHVHIKCVPFTTRAEQINGNVQLFEALERCEKNSGIFKNTCSYSNFKTIIQTLVELSPKDSNFSQLNI